MNTIDHKKLSILSSDSEPLDFKYIQDQIAEAADRYPQRIAVETSNASLTYNELLNRANALAKQLQDAGVSLGDYVGIWQDRSIEMVVAILAVLKAGAAYIPLDPSYPLDRLQFILKDTGAKVILTTDPFINDLQEDHSTIIRIDHVKAKDTKVKLQVNYSLNAPVYVIHTSGSTGKPKGVAVNQANLIHSNSARKIYYDGSVGKFLLLSSFSFDSSVAGIFWTLSGGGTLCLPKSGVEQDAGRIATCIHEFAITHMLALPSLYQLVLEQGSKETLRSLKHVIVAGEACSPELAGQHFKRLPNTRLYNEYGPTEASVWSTVYEIPAAFSAKAVPIGKPIPGSSVLILDEELNLLPRGEAGELFVAGPGVTAGYLNQPELTANKFLESPKPLHKLLPEEYAGLTLYRTGDRVSCNADGDLEFHGRVDQQIKLRGFRIEPGEIESCMLDYPGVAEAAVILREDRPGVKRLTGYILKKDEDVNLTELRKQLHQSLPVHMIPTSFVVLDGFPRIPNGKVDRNAFPAPDRSRPPLEQPYSAAVNKLEKKLQQMWCAILDLDEVGTHDPFFDLGGDSLLAARFIGELQKQLEEPVFVVTLFSAPTIASYATFLQRDYTNSVSRWLGEQSSVKTDDQSKALQVEDQQRFQNLVPQVEISKTKVSKKAKNSPAIFILAPPRSGTTLLRVMLAGHSKLFAANELQLLGFESMRERSDAYSGKYSVWLDGLVRTVMELKQCSAEEAQRMISKYEKKNATTREMFAALQDLIGDRILVDKSPQYALDIPALQRAERDFDNPLYIQLVRHPYAMVSSFVKRRMKQVVYLKDNNFSDRETGELVWLESHRRTADFLQRIPADRKMVLRYEDLVTDPRAAMKMLFKTFNLPFEEAVLNPYTNLEGKMIDGVHADSTPMGDPKFMQQKSINPTLADAWKGVLEDNFLSEMTWNQAEQFGYEKPKKQFAGSANAPLENIEIAIIGMAARFPGAETLDEVWENLSKGVESIRRLSDEELRARGIDEQTIADPQYVKAGASPKDIDKFDAAFFGFHKREAELMDPQHRMFLEGAWSALEHAGYDPERYDGEIGVFGGVARNSYLTANLMTDPDFRDRAGDYINTLGSEKDFPATRVAHKLNLRGPAMTIQTACSTTGVAIHMASQSLRNGDCQMAIIGGCRVQVPDGVGYHHVEGGPLSVDGHLRAFDADATGMVKASGGAFLVLKPLSVALEDGDTVHAVIKATAINNDGSDKAGFTAPGVDGQARVIGKALQRAGISPESISYMEAHGTGTVLGDPIEVGALTKAWRHHTDKKQFCALGSVKTNIGHLDAGACAASIVKTALALKHRQIPANLHFKSPNPQLDLPNSPFFVNSSLLDWQSNGQPRRAAVSSLGLGGTNAHLILEEAPEQEKKEQTEKPRVLVLSSRSDDVLQQMRLNLADYLEKHPEINLQDVAHTLVHGRKLFEQRLAIAVENRTDAIERLRNAPAHQLVKHSQKRVNRSVAFMFAGGGAQYVRMGQQLYSENSTFRNTVDECAEILIPIIQADIRELLYPKSDTDEVASKKLESPSLTLPALFAIQYACAQLWMGIGVHPSSMIGHSMGEYTAACLAGVFSLEDALALVSIRGKLFETLEDGSMLSVPLTESELKPMLGDELSFAAINHFDSCVVSGPTPKIEALQQNLESREVECTRLRISVAAHSAMVEPILEPFKEFLEGIDFEKPQIPFVSNLSGNWVTGDEVTTPEYWLRHLRETVRFADGLSCLLKDEHMLLLEMGPGRTLSSFARAHPEKKPEQVIVTSLRHPREEVEDHTFLNNSIGWLWAAGIQLKWDKIIGSDARRVPLPTYPFERKTYWIEPQQGGQQTVAITGRESMIKEDIDVTTVKMLPSRAERVGDELQRIIHELSGVDMAAIERDTSFLELGFDSLFLTQANSAFQKLFKVKISFRQLFEEAPTINLLAAFIDGKMPPEAFPAPEPEPAPVQEAAPVAAASSAPAVQAAPMQPIQVNAESGTMQQIVQQQLQLMQQQLQLLGGVPQPTVSQPAQVVTSTPAGQVASTPVQESTSVASANGKKGDGAAHGPWKPVQRKRANEYTDRQMNALEKLIADYTKKTAGSKALTQSQRPRLADPRAITGFRHVWKEMIYQIAGVRSKGSRIWDVDDNEYIDLNMGFGINFFGHSPDFVINAVEEQLAKGIELGVLTPLAKDVAELICELTGMERVNFVNTGSEAVSAAVRAARTASGKDRIAVFRKDYHGISDELLVRPVDLGGKRLSKPVSPGIPDFLVENVIILEYDDSCLDVIREHADDLAGVIFEPVPAHDPAFQPREIIHKVREVTRELDIAMIFDELITGFRLHPRGAQGFYDVDVDICAYGKIVCGGLPMAAVAGSAKYMNAFDGGMWQFGDDSYPEGGVTFFGGTFVRHPLCLASSRAVLQKMHENGTKLHDDLNAKTEAFAADVNDIFKRHHAPMEMVRCASMILIRFLEDGPFNPLFWFYLRLNGVLFRDRSGFLCVDHTQEDLKTVLKAIEDSVLQMKAAGFMPGQDADEDPSFLALDGQPTELPLTPSQVEIWLASQLGEKASCAFNLSSRLTLKGAFDKDVLQRSVNQLTQRHEALRTTFSSDGSMQYIAKDIGVNFSYVDLSELDNSTGEEMLAEICEEDVRTAFDLVNGPLIRFHIVRTRPDQHEIIMSVHHIICDGWSFGVLLKDLAAFYSANVKGEQPSLTDPLQFRDFVDIQNENLEIVGSSSKEYWQSQYKESIPVLELPTDYPRPRNRSYDGGYRRLKLDNNIFKGVQKFASEQRSTTFGVLMAAYGAFLSRLSSQEEVVIGLAAAGQTAIGKQEVVGHCVTLLPIRLPVPGGEKFVDYFGEMKGRLMEAYDHQDYTFGDLLTSLGIERDPSRLPLVSTMITYETGSEKLNFGNLITDVSANPKGYCNFDLELYLMEDKGELTMRMEYNSELFNASTIERWLKHFQVMLGNIVSDDETPIQRIAMIPSAEMQRMIYSWNDTQVTYPAERGMHELFEEQADFLKEDAIAAIFPSEGKKHISYSYFELEQRANRLANFLIKNGVKEGDFVGVYLDRGSELLTTLLAILKTGAAYVPLDPSFPVDRIRFMIEDSGMSLILSSEALADGLSGVADNLLLVDKEAARIGRSSKKRIKLKPNPERLAYVIYTSGSTGKPKGVQIAHHSVVNFLMTMGTDRPGFTKQDKLLALTTISFDISVLELFLPLANGGTVVVASGDTQQDVQKLTHLLETYSCTMMQATPTNWAMLFEAGWKGKKDLKVFCGGEAMPQELAARLYDSCAEVWNMYGPTETTIWSAVSKITSPSTPVQIGSAVGNNQLYVLDAHMNPQPIGVPGELYIGGRGLAVGYLNREDLTKERFPNVQLPGEMKPTRLYKTGDRVCWTEEGTLTFLGRIDHQVKLRGYRIELGEIESLLNELPEVERAVVAVKEWGPGDKRLAAYVLKTSANGMRFDKAKDVLRGRLPEYMVPSSIMAIEAFPLTPNGKVDRNALPLPGTAVMQEEAAEKREAETETEIALLKIWQEVLSLSDLNVTDDFFDVGGHSLLATRVIMKINEHFNTELLFSALFEYATIEKLAIVIDKILVEEQFTTPQFDNLVEGSL